MPSVADELAALRKNGITKNLAANLHNASGLSTPEQEEAALKAKAAKERSSNYKKDAAETLKAGGKGVDRDLDFKVKQKAQKVQDQQKRKSAVEILNAGVKEVDRDLDFKVQQITKKKEDEKKKKEAKTNLQGFNEAKLAVTSPTGTGRSSFSGERSISDMKGAIPPPTDQEPAPSTSSGKNNESAAVVASDAKLTDGSAAPTVTPVSTPAVASTTVPLPTASAPIPPAAATAAASTTAPPVSANATTMSQTDNTTAMEGVEDIPELEQMDDDAIPELTADGTPTVQDQQPASTAPPAAYQHKQNRAEKKSRKMIQRLGMNQVRGITRVTIKAGGNQGYFYINQPDVYEKNGSYVIFGEARQGSGFERQAAMQQAQAAQNIAAPDETTAPPQMSTITEIEDDDDVDESGVDPKDIDLVMSQAGCSRTKAVAALKQNDGDLVNAIMSLTA